MTTIDEIINRNLKEIVAAEVSKAMRAAETPFHDLPDTALTSEVAAALRTTENTLRKNLFESGIPHKHLGGELRFTRAALVEWAMNGKTRFDCETCAARICQPDKSDGEPARSATVSTNVLPMSTTRKLVEVYGKGA